MPSQRASQRLHAAVLAVALLASQTLGQSAPSPATQLLGPSGQPLQGAAKDGAPSLMPNAASSQPPVQLTRMGCIWLLHLCLFFVKYPMLSRQAYQECSARLRGLPFQRSNTLWSGGFQPSSLAR